MIEKLWRVYVEARKYIDGINGLAPLIAAVTDLDLDNKEALAEIERLTDELADMTANRDFLRGVADANIKLVSK